MEAIICNIILIICTIGALIIILFDPDEEFGGGDEYKIIVAVILGIVWPVGFICVISLTIIGLIRYVKNMCDK